MTNTARKIPPCVAQVRSPQNAMVVTPDYHLTGGVRCFANTERHTESWTKNLYNIWIGKNVMKLEVDNFTLTYLGRVLGAKPLHRPTLAYCHSDL